MREIHVFEFLGKKVVDRDGRHVGRLEEIEATRGDENCPIDAFIVEHRGLLDRVSTWALTTDVQRHLPQTKRSRPFRVPWNEMDLSDPAHPRVTVSRDQLRRMPD